MNRDERIDSILREIQRDYLKEFGKELDIDDIFRAVDAQPKFVLSCIEQTKDVSMPYIGKFKDRNVRNEHREERRARLKASKRERLEQNQKLLVGSLASQGLIKGITVISKNK